MKNRDKASAGRFFNIKISVFWTCLILFAAGIIAGVYSSYNSDLSIYFKFIPPGILWGGTYLIRAFCFFYILFLFCSCSFLAPVLIILLSFLLGGATGYVISSAILLNDQLTAFLISLLPVILFAIPASLTGISAGLSFWVDLISKSIKKERFDFGNRLTVLLTVLGICFIGTVFSAFLQNQIIKMLL